MTTYTEREITQPVQLCDSNGNLNKESIGWARNPIITSNLTGHFLRKKKWNYWCVFGKDAMFSATISHLDYAAVCFVYTLEYSTKKFHEETILIPFSKKVVMSENVYDSMEAIHKDLGIFFVWNEDHMTLKVSSIDFGGEALKTDIKINYPTNLDTLNVVVPWNDNQFQFTAKHHCLPAEGEFSLGSKTFTFNPETDFAVLDYGRGVWPRESTWNWGMASGRQSDDVIGLNFGGQWTDRTGSNENAVILNGSITKINEDVEFIYDQADYMKPWKIHTVSEQVRLTFTPFFERKAYSNVLVVKSDVHQMVGHYSGEIQLPNGKTLVIDGLLGCIEEHMAKW
ncbi:hypothetical protein CIL05_18390 [Virgibacillus profundi]|uniref:DUF2804 domain-containing protein n=1 Tax=Virgibacillus profundi TaxID=2024555 RepID=A0A2A2I9N0_9BACI|nr:DUF2804 domain-containing protein [Virgibacillus profundi]PAV28078.1 hypothetical protein CIL05_18390 [Virgibacillus profundi]PXY52382.1 DUF2804 domain-containing protein [Virgibacillus profundi]